MMALYEDQTLWTNPADSLSNESSMSTLIYVSGLIKDAKSCRDILTTMTQASFVLGEVHGAAFLGSSCVRAFRLAATTCMNETALAESWDICSDIIILLGKVNAASHFLDINLFSNLSSLSTPGSFSR